MRQLREMARRAQTHSLDDWRRWLEVISVTDPIDGAERDPLDLELGLENLIRLAAQYDDEEFGCARGPIRRGAGSHIPGVSTDCAGQGIAAPSGGGTQCLRRLAPGPWPCACGARSSSRAPLADPIAEPDLEKTWSLVAGTPAELLDVVNERRQSQSDDEQVELALEVLAVRLGGYALDACGDVPELGPGRGAHGAQYLPVVA